MTSLRWRSLERRIESQLNNSNPSQLLKKSTLQIWSGRADRLELVAWILAHLHQGWCTRLSPPSNVPDRRYFVGWTQGLRRVVRNLHRYLPARIWSCLYWRAIDHSLSGCWWKAIQVAKNHEMKNVWDALDTKWTTESSYFASMIWLAVSHTQTKLSSLDILGIDLRAWDIPESCEAIWISKEIIEKGRSDRRKSFYLYNIFELILVAKWIQDLQASGW